jgi:quercetin dioxygenase-like cupin family protein
MFRSAFIKINNIRKMVNLSSKLKTSLWEKKMPDTASFLTYDIPSLINEMKNSKAWMDGNLKAKILLKSPKKKIVLTALHEGTEINSFQANDSITFQIIEGQLRFISQKESVTIEEGQLLTVKENINYCLTTMEETIFLLTIASGLLSE